MAVTPIPAGFHTITPYIVIPGVSTVLNFIAKAFDAQEIRRVSFPDGTIMNVEVRIGNSMLMFAEARGEYRMPGSIYMYVPDTDAVFLKAVQAGGEALMEPADQFYGDRNAAIIDPCGNYWWIATRVKEVTDEELQKGAAERMKK